MGFIQPDLCMILHDHSPMGFSGQFVALFRQPEQRLLSAWYDDEDIFRAEPVISRCAVNRTVERYLTMEEFIEKSLGYFLSVSFPKSAFACWVKYSMFQLDLQPTIIGMFSGLETRQWLKLHDKGGILTKYLFDIFCATCVYGKSLW